MQADMRQLVEKRKIVERLRWNIEMLMYLLC
jgi:hypothetical protein